MQLHAQNLIGSMTRAAEEFPPSQKELLPLPPIETQEQFFLILNALPDLKMKRHGAPNIKCNECFWDTVWAVYTDALKKGEVL